MTVLFLPILRNKDLLNKNNKKKVREKFEEERLNIYKK